MTEPQPRHSTKLADSSDWDHSSHDQFFQYYANASQNQTTVARFLSIRNTILRILNTGAVRSPVLEVADIGCGAGTQCMLWAELGHRTHGLDVSEALIRLARERAQQAGYAVDFQIGSATFLPWPDKSMEVCLLLELLEHVAEWKACINECVRILRPGGILFITTSNKLCPRQSEFNLPLYSWYPKTLKRYFEHLAKTTHPALANFATYPAINWFSFYSLRSFLSRQGMRCFDRFDLFDTQNSGFASRSLIYCIRRIQPLRWIAHFGTQGTTVLAFKPNEASNDPPRVHAQGETARHSTKR